MRLVTGFGLLIVAVAVRCFTPVTGGVVATFGAHLPALRTIDLVTGPFALLALGIVASTPAVPPVRRVLGAGALVIAIAWPAIKFADMGPVVLTLTRTHGVHTHDALLVPWLAAGLSLLAPPRAVRRRALLLTPTVVSDAGRVGVETTLRAA